MKFATKTATKKRSRQRVRATAAPAGVIRARAALEALGTREAVAIDARTAVLLALADITSLVSVTDNNGVITVTPFDVFNRTFDDPQVGLDDAQMVLLYGKVSTAIGEERVKLLIHKHLTSNASATVLIIDVANLIQFWIDNPDQQA